MENSAHFYFFEKIFNPLKELGTYLRTHVEFVRIEYVSNIHYRPMLG